MTISAVGRKSEAHSADDWWRITLSLIRPTLAVTIKMTQYQRLGSRCMAGNLCYTCEASGTSEVIVGGLVEEGHPVPARIAVLAQPAGTVIIEAGE